MLTEADTCRKFVVPKLQDAGWDNAPHSIAKQCTIADGRLVPTGQGMKLRTIGCEFDAHHAMNLKLCYALQGQRDAG